MTEKLNKGTNTYFKVLLLIKSNSFLYYFCTQEEMEDLHAFDKYLLVYNHYSHKYKNYLSVTKLSLSQPVNTIDIIITLNVGLLHWLLCLRTVYTDFVYGREILNPLNFDTVLDSIFVKSLVSI